MWAFISRLPFVATLVTFVCVVIMFTLGNWQLQRAEQKTSRLLDIQLAAKSEQIDLSQILLSDVEKNIDMPVNFKGQPDLNHYFLLDNKIHQGRVGYQALIPVQTNSGTVIVNFGWVAATNSRMILPDITIDIKEKHYSGIVSVPQNNTMITETALVDGNWPKLLQQTDLKVMQQHYKQQILPLVVLLNPEESSTFVRNWQAVVMAPEKHMAYAVQWFLLAFAAIAVFVFAQRNKLKRNKK